MEKNTFKPEIMAPVGGVNSFFAALAAGADACYLGLKHFSARMLADNFSISELARIKAMADERSMKIYVTMNTLLKPGEAEQAGRLIDRLVKNVHPQALIVQDLGLIPLARQAGYAGEIHLSTLANLSQPGALALAADLGATRVVIPRELDVDEIRAMAEACPEGLELEAFVHGALCYSVSGRCWWSSYMGGKSGLRGRCVQPCRRMYRRGGDKARDFSCRDLSLDVLTKPLLSMPKVAAWKIEGRKKGPHYVFYTVKAYQLFRDHPNDAAAKKQAVDYLDQALGRPSTHGVFLPQRKHSPLAPDGETGSGRLVGQVKRDGKRLYAALREPLMAGDFLRVGYEDEPWHTTIRVRRSVPKRGRLDFSPKKGRPAPASGTRIFLMDRREPELVKILRDMKQEFESIQAPEPAASSFVPSPPRNLGARPKVRNMVLSRNLRKGGRDQTAAWLDQTSLDKASATGKPCWWLPPVIWPGEEDHWASLVKRALKSGAKDFLLGAPWQMAFFPESKDLNIWAGPFCNVANSYSIEVLRQMGFSGAIASPELTGQDFLDLPGQSPLPLGVVVEGLWPLGISRIPVPGSEEPVPFTSPKGEVCWIKGKGPNQWVYPGWKLDISAHREQLVRAGYALFVTMNEPWPKSIPRPSRTSEFNWKLKLL